MPDEVRTLGERKGEGGEREGDAVRGEVGDKRLIKVASKKKKEKKHSLSVLKHSLGRLLLARHVVHHPGFGHVRLGQGD